MRVASMLDLGDAQRDILVKLAQSNTTEVRLARRASIVLLAADGLSNREIAQIVGVGRIQVGRWRERYVTGGLKAIEQDLPRGGRKPKVNAADIVRLTTQTQPEGATQWSTRTLAAVAGVSDTTVQRIWKAHGLKPHRVKHFKVSRDPKFVEKLEDIVGLYLSPPEYALGLCCDEKSQVQALDRTQPGLPMKPLFRVHRWLANLRVLDVDEIKSVPHVPVSHPFIERLIGTIRREYLDRVFFWNAVDLMRKLNAFGDYYNAFRGHRSLDGTTQAQRAGASSPAPITLAHHAWRKHCGGLFQTPVAA